MHLDVQDLRNFYYRSALGRAVQKSIRDQVLRMWPEATGQTVLGFGFAVPLLRPYLKTARRVVALMPGPQGVMPWPAGLANVSALCHETQWPIETGHVDRLIVMHGLESSDAPNAILDEAFRVLGPGGKMIVIVPNRAGLWVRADHTPFGYGRPYTLGQLETLLHLHQFMPEAHCSALHFPPSQKRFWLKTAPVFERLGNRLSNHLTSGVLMVEVSKRVQQPIDKGRAIPERSLQALAGLRPAGARRVSRAPIHEIL